MRLHTEEVVRRTKLISDYFRQNPHSGIRQAQEFLAAQGEKTMNHKSVYKIRDTVRRELFSRPAPQRIVPQPERKAAGLSAPILSALRALSSMMESQRVESLSISLEQGKPHVRFTKLTPQEGETTVAPLKPVPQKPAATQVAPEAAAQPEPKGTSA